MFAINHAATALLIQRRFPQQPMVWLLVSVQLMEVLWVILNLLGVERTTTGTIVRSTADIHLNYMPFSHSAATMLGVALLAWLVCRVGLHRPTLGLAIAIGIASHFLLDLVTHAPDIPITPGLDNPKLGLGLYSAAPLAAFAVELGYGVLCWWVYKGGKALLTVIILFNAANLSLLSPQISGPESAFANQPTLLVFAILSQIVVTLFLVGFFSRRPAPAYLGNRST